MYYIIEIQNSAPDAYAHIVHTAETRNRAESTYHQVLAAAAVSGLPCHSATLIDGRGRLVMSCYYAHEAEEAE